MQTDAARRTLAILGNAPAFSEPLHVGRPNMGDRPLMMQRIGDVIDSRRLTNGGPYLEQFEERIAAYVGVENCVVMANATVALEVAIRALGMDGEVIVPSFTFIATAHALLWQQITPVFCDIDPVTATIDPAAIEALITPRTTGILGVHVWGRPCAIESIAEIARRHGLRLLFDSAHAFGCSHRGQMIGNFGDAEVFSFHATKFVNSLEGGAVVTADAGLASRMRSMRNFGFTSYDQISHLGINGKMSEMSAAVGLTNLESVGEFIAVNRANLARYAEGLAAIPGLHLRMPEPGERNNFQYVVIEVDEDAAGIDRDTVQAVLWAENVLARRYFYPGCHRSEPYRSMSMGQAPLANTESLSERVLSLPTGTGVDLDAIDTICALIAVAVNHATFVKEAVRVGGRPESLLATVH